ncbi:LLM class flavin-dependent oxidoreductase [Pseudonocardia halophobica]|uniref:LLM class flavin-dependent oxidoreductase n=1 Tax=Pseudonocardia halophobica TaxID=29401 RepID=UPI003D949A4A
MRFGVQIFPYHKPWIDPSVQFEDDLRLIEHLDRLGYDEVWVGEHHSTGWQNVAAPELFLAAAAQRTQTIKLGTGVSSLPYHHPFMLVDRIVQLSHMLKGRLLWGIGAGSLAQDAQTIGVEPLEQRRMTEEALEAILALLRFDGPVTRKTDWFEINDGQLHLRPYAGELDIRVASQLSPSGPRLAGKFGTGLFQFGVLGTTEDNPIAQTWGIAEESAQAHGQTVSRDRWSALHMMHIAETEEEARAQARWGLQDWVRYMVSILPLVKSDPEDFDAVVEELNDSIFVIGTPEMARERIATIVEKSGGLGSIVIGNCEIASPKHQFDSFELLAREVFPHFTGQIAPRLEGVESMARFGATGEKLAAAQEKARREYAAEKEARSA